MNSMSRNHHNCNSNHSCRKDDRDHRDCRNEDRDHRDCRKEDRDHRDCRTIIKCGNGSAASILEGTESGTKFTVASLTLDTSCLCNPVTKLEFSSNVVTSDDFNGSISFQVFKLCKGQFKPTPVGSSWIFSITDSQGQLAKQKGALVAAPEAPGKPGGNELWPWPWPSPKALSSTFSFHVCDCDSCFDDCCTFTVVAKVISPEYTSGNLFINNPTFTAMSTCGSCNCC